MKNNKFYFVILVSILLVPRMSLAWDSIGVFTHDKLADDAIILVLPLLHYPDIHMYQEALRDGSESEEPHPGLTHLAYNGGNVTDWWQNKALLTYKASNFSSAYYRIGQIGHLTQDQAVPAHAANISHGPAAFHLDNFESYADQHYVSNPGNGYLNDSFPFDYYQSLQDTTRDNLTSWTKPSTLEQYWIAPQSAPPIPPGGYDITGGYDPPENFDWGSYGGSGSTSGEKDIYTMLASTESPEIVTVQIGRATASTAGVFAAASRKLPPLTKNLDISPSSSISPQIDLTNGSEISFDILENRKDTVKIYIIVDSTSGPGVINSSYRTGKSFSLSGGTSLPWEGSYFVTRDRGAFI